MYRKKTSHSQRKLKYYLEYEKLSDWKPEPLTVMEKNKAEGSKTSQATETEDS